MIRTEWTASLESQRILVLGAGGWFGKTLADLIAGVPVLQIGSRRREQIETWNFKRVRDFAPTLVFNFAFLTEDKIEVYGMSEFERLNRVLISRAKDACGIESVNSVVSISSGAVSEMLSGRRPGSLYAQLKMEEEDGLRKVTGENCLVIPRVYSVSGPYVKSPSHYAFSSFVEGAIRGELEVNSERRAFRRYCTVRSVLEVSTSLALSRESRVFETGGDLVELRALSEKIRDLVNPKAIIRMPNLVVGESSYHSNNHEWKTACLEAGLSTPTLERQIMDVAAYFTKRQPTGNHELGSVWK